MKKYIVAVLLLSVGLFYAQDGSGKYSIKNLEINTSRSDFVPSFLGENKLIQYHQRCLGA